MIDLHSISLDTVLSCLSLAISIGSLAHVIRKDRNVLISAGISKLVLLSFIWFFQNIKHKTEINYITKEVIEKLK